MPGQKLVLFLAVAAWIVGLMESGEVGLAVCDWKGKIFLFLESCSGEFEHLFHSLQIIVTVISLDSP